MLRFLAALALIPAVAIAAVQTRFLIEDEVEGYEHPGDKLQDEGWQRTHPIEYIPGCFYDFKDDRVFEIGGHRSDDMSHEWCRLYCERELKYPIYMGLENGNQCWCTDVDGICHEAEDAICPRQVPIEDGEQCNKGCVGKDWDDCGDRWRLKIVKIGEWVSPS